MEVVTSSSVLNVRMGTIKKIYIIKWKCLLILKSCRFNRVLEVIQTL